MRPNPTESRWPVALVAVLVIPTALATAQTASHGALVELYRDDPDGAVAELGRWDLRAVERQIAQIDSRPRSRRAAIMLHTEMALTDLAQRRHERGDLRAAEARYRLATTALPGVQSAAVALSHLLARRGDARSARSVAHAGLDAQRELPVDSDPWWFYPHGNPTFVEAQIAKLRHEARTGP
jgi:hypothetical protein